MGLFSQLLKVLGEGETPQERDKRINDKLLIDEARAYGLTKEELEECKKSGITPEEWVKENKQD